jgi:hypothetical protein
VFRIDLKNIQTSGIPMGFLPLPSHIHYELLLQLLERQTLPALKPGSERYDQVQQIIIHLRKALSCQKQLESSMAYAGLEVEHRWSLNPPPPNVPIAPIGKPVLGENGTETPSTEPPSSTVRS